VCDSKKNRFIPLKGIIKRIDYTQAKIQNRRRDNKKQVKALTETLM